MIFHPQLGLEKNHLDLFESYKHGPIQRDEAVFLFGMVRVIRPSTIVEFGLQTGLSAYNFCLAKDEDCFYFGLDKEQFCVDSASKLCKNLKNCFFIKDDCVNFNSEMIQGRFIDLFFLDCSHIFELNKKCLQKVIPLLSKNGIVIIHDTGYYTTEGFEKSPESYRKKNEKLGDNIRKSGKVAVIKSEQKTVNWFMDEYAEFSVMHFHSDKVMRNGMTLMQKTSKLD